MASSKNKRPRRNTPQKNAGMTDAISDRTCVQSALSGLFEIYRQELDSKHDKYERLVKTSRDLTIASKRMIFQLHRDDRCNVEVEKRIGECQTFLRAIMNEVVHEDVHRYHRAFSPGLQEFVEAVSFFHFKKFGTIVSYRELCDKYIGRLDDKCETIGNILPDMDYILGIGDLTGELMRMCINSIGAGEHEIAKRLARVLREIYDSLIIYNIPGGDRKFSVKLNTLGESLKKVEDACYQVHIRGNEMPQHVLAEIALGKEDIRDDE